MDNIARMSPAEIVAKADEVAQMLIKDKLKTGQIRNFYSAVTRMRTDFANRDEGNKEEKRKALQTDITMLKPKLAYAAGRQTAVRATFYPIMRNAIDGIINANYNEEAFDNFFMFAESVVAYHKFYGGE
jgi:CRISPR-associated protein Csm2